MDINTKKSSKKSNRFLDIRLEALKSEDEMEVLLNLQELNRDLLVATDQIAEDINCQHLIKQLIELFNKFFLPDITMNAIICLNALLDINPMFTSTIVKHGGIPKILETMTQNIEYIDIAESAIKGIEKISYENPFVLLENDSFCMILNLIEFFELSLRKTAMKACVNMSRGINSLDLIKKFIIPAIPNISNLAKLVGNSDAEKFILDQSITCFYNVIHSIKAYNLAKNEPKIYDQLIQYGILDNLFEVLSSFLNILNDDSKNPSNKNLNIYVDTFKNILKVFEILCSQSAEITNLVLNMNILEIINTILFKELNFLDQKTKFSSSNISLFAEIFALLIAFFPNPSFSKAQQHVQMNKKENFSTKLMSESNKNYYVYFSEKILSILVKNIVNMPSTSTILEVIHLIELYVTYSPKDQIIIYIDPVKLSNICSKMLDSKDTTYISKIITLVEIVMNTCPETFIETFIREGVIDNIKSIITCEDANFYIPEEKTNLNPNHGIKPNKYFYENKLSVENNDQVNNDYGSNYSDQYGSYDDEIDFVDKIKKEKPIGATTSVTANDPSQPTVVASKSPSRPKSPIAMPEKTEKANTNPMANIFNQMKSIFTKKSEGNNDAQTQPTGETPSAFQKLEKLSEKIKSEKKEEKSEPLFSLNSYSGVKEAAAQLRPKKSFNSTVSLIKNKCKEIVDKYFNDALKIEEYLKKAGCNSHPQEIFAKLNALSGLIKENTDIDDDTLKQIIDMLVNKNQKLTFYEIEKSNIVHNLSKFIDPNFIINLEESAEKPEKILKSPHPDFLIKLKRLFKVIKENSKNISDLVSTLQYSISSMNCFKLYLYEYDNYKNVSHLFLAPLKQQNYKIKVAFNYFKNETLSLGKYNNNLDEQSEKVLKDLHDYYSNVKQITLYLDQNDTFSQIAKTLLSKTKSSESPFPTLKNYSTLKKTFNDQQKQIYEDLINTMKDEDPESSTKIIEKLLEKNVNLNQLPQNVKDSLELKNPEEFFEEEQKSVDLNEEIEKQPPSDSQPKIEEILIKENKSESKPSIDSVTVNFFMKIGEEKHKIKSSWSLVDLFRDAKNMSKADMNSLYDIQIFFEFVPLNQADKADIVEYSTNNQEAELDLCMLSSTLENLTNMQEKFFFKNYSQIILGNKALYTIKRASPFFYMIALFELCVNNYGDLFNLKERIDEKILENHKVSSLLTKQVRDPFAISSSTIPVWCKELCQNYPFIANFNSRYLFFKTCSFETKRSMINLAIFVKNFLGEAIFDEKTLAGGLKRKKFTVDRNNLLHSVEKAYHEIGNFNGYLEIQYINEEGTGNGPTLEFYSLFSKEIREKPELWYKTSDLSLFPLPYNTITHLEYTHLFELIGFMIARGLYDDRLLDIPLNSLFWDLIFERPLSISKIAKIDKHLGQVLNHFSCLISEKERILSEDKYANLEERLLYNGKKISEIDIYFVLPGTNIELKEKGSEILVTADNFEEYLHLVYEVVCGKGIKDYIDSFKKGFNSVFNINSLKCFQTIEIEEILCGSVNEPWDIETLVENIVPNHGYDRNHNIYKYLISLMKELEPLQKKKFLYFVTGCPRLPLGGFKNLNPKLTVVKKNPDIPMEDPDLYLPTVMTCQNYLKIPEYSCYEVFKAKFLTAMTEGHNTFLLS